MNIDKLFSGIEDSLIDVHSNKIDSINFDNKTKTEDYTFTLNVRGHDASGAGKKDVSDIEFRRMFNEKLCKTIEILKSKAIQMATNEYENINIEKNFHTGKYYFRFKLLGFKKKELEENDDN